MRVACDVVLRDARDRPQADCDEAGDPRDQQPVELPHDPAQGEALATVALEPCSR
jgi:hypothetical protein